jgi:uncharacterized membrane protein YfcA
MSTVEIILIITASMAAGAVNALAGGGTLITFPTLVALGIPPIAANVTNTVALVPGYFGATLSQIKDMRGQEKRLIFLLPAGALGGVIGGLLLLNTGEKVFGELIPFLLLLASILLAVQDPLRSWIQRRISSGGSKSVPEAWTAAAICAAGVYGGYFGAGLSVIVLAVLGLSSDESLTRLNAIKQAIAFSINITAALLFVFSGMVVWSTALLMAVGALVGGALGGKLAGRIKPAVLRWLVVTIGVIIAIVYFIRG